MSKNVIVKILYTSGAETKVKGTLVDPSGLNRLKKILKKLMYKQYAGLLDEESVDLEKGFTIINWKYVLCAEVIIVEQQ